MEFRNLTNRMDISLYLMLFLSCLIPHPVHTQAIVILLVCFSVFLGPYLRYMEVHRLGVESELQVPAYATTIATRDPSYVCDLHHSSQQCQSLNQLSEARDRSCVFMDTSWVFYH